ncbi:MAG: enoyl-CoA hydratase/isomerase family protein [Rhodospirillales bacterium]|nr:enoyl-CoA hydratase/isomerase family protein [Rhodospirillales bacterium]
MQDTVLTDVSDGIATLTLNNPAKLNAWDTPMRARIQAVLEDWNRRSDVKAVILTGAGERAFSAGQDLDETEKFKSGADGAKWFLSWRAFYDSLRNLEKPSVAALNGLAAGSAFQLMMLTDVRVGYPGSKVGQPEINAGIPSVLGPMLMFDRIGLSRTVEMTLMGRMLEAEEAKAIGLIHHLVVAPVAVMPKAREIARQLASKPATAMRLTKKWFRALTQPQYDNAFANGAAIQAEAYASGEPQEAMRRFFAERAKGGRASGG